MARRPRIFAPGLLYHVIARGNQRQRTFLTDLDDRAYLVRLATYRKRYGVRLYAYCLMPNHVHLLVQTSEPPLSKFMQGVQQSYTQRFNRVHGKVGHLSGTPPCATAPDLIIGLLSQECQVSGRSAQQ